LALVEIAVFQPTQSAERQYLLVPHLRGAVVAEQRQVVRVVAEGDRTSIKVEPTAPVRIKSTGQKWDYEGFMRDAKAKSLGAAEAANRLVQWFTNDRVKWGSGKEATFTARIMLRGQDVEFLRVYAEGSVHVALRSLPEGAFRDETKAKLSEIAGVKVRDDIIGAETSLSTLANPSTLKQFLEVCKWVIEKSQSLPA